MRRVDPGHLRSDWLVCQIGLSKPFPSMLDHAGSGEMGAKMGAKCASVLTTRPAFTSSSPAGCRLKKFDSGRDGVLVIPVEPVQTARRADVCSVSAPLLGCRRARPRRW